MEEEVAQEEVAQEEVAQVAQVAQQEVAQEEAVQEEVAHAREEAARKKARKKKRKRMKEFKERQEHGGYTLVPRGKCGAVVPNGTEATCLPDALWAAMRAVDPTLAASQACILDMFEAIRNSSCSRTCSGTKLKIKVYKNYN